MGDKRIHLFKRNQYKDLEFQGWTLSLENAKSVFPNGRAMVGSKTYFNFKTLKEDFTNVS